MAVQLAEIAGAKGTENLQVASAPSLHAELSDGALTVTAANLAACELRYYRGRSRGAVLQPAIRPHQRRAAGPSTSPALSVVVPLDATHPTTRIPLDAAYRSRNVMLEIEAAGQRQVLLSFASRLDVRLATSQGELQVLDAGTGAALPAAYVKVYAESSAGQVGFLKDGYTDLRGRFDYVRLSTADDQTYKRLALYIDADAHGSTVRVVVPPTR